MDFTVTLIRSLDHSILAEVIQLPGVLALAPTPHQAFDAVVALARDVLADEPRLAEGEAIDSVHNFRPDPASQRLLVEGSLKANVERSTNSDTLEQVYDVRDRVQDAVGTLGRVIADALGQPRARGLKAADVLDELKAAGWDVHRTAATHRTLRDQSGKLLVFPFRDDERVRNDTLDRISALAGVRLT